jgi:AraC-like DNA-binding protein
MNWKMAGPASRISGLNGASYFQSAFRRRFDMTPSGYNGE